MRFAIPCEGPRVADHFTTASHFAFYDANPKDGEILQEIFVETPMHEPASLPHWIADRGTDVVLAPELSSRIRQSLTERGVAIISGVAGTDPRLMVRDYLNDTLTTVGQSAGAASGCS
jgi:ATP-binding protein involved in chromosome partitioning